MKKYGSMIATLGLVVFTTVVVCVFFGIQLFPPENVKVSFRDLEATVASGFLHDIDEGKWRSAYDRTTETYQRDNSFDTFLAIVRPFEGFDHVTCGSKWVGAEERIIQGRFMTKAGTIPFTLRMVKYGNDFKVDSIKVGGE